MFSHMIAWAIILAVSQATSIPLASNAIAGRNTAHLSISQNTLPMKRLTKPSGLRKRSSFRDRDVQCYDTAALAFLASSDEFAVNITFGNQTFPVVLDTGSSETFVAGAGFQCQDFTGKNVSISECHLANLYSPSNTFQPVPGEVFEELFGGGDLVIGYVGYEQVTLGGVEVTQKVGIMTSGYWEVADDISGLAGFAFPSLSTIYNGSGPSDPAATSNSTNLVIHNPLFFNMVAQGKVASPVFSLVLERSDTGSYLTLGGIPEQFADAEFVTTAILPSEFALRGNETLVNTEFAFEVSGVSIDGMTNMTAFRTFADSGGKGILLDNSTAAAAVAAFDPPGYFNPNYGYIVNCSATAPAFEVIIETTTFAVDPKDLILHSTKMDDNICLTAFQSNDELGGANVLGNPFLRSVVSVFDIGHNQMHFAAK